VAPVAILAAAAAVSSGLHGVVTKGPITPVCRVGIPCSAPAANTTLVFTRLGLAKQVTTDWAGRYRIRLVPGRYAVRVRGARFGFRPTSVFVRADVFRLINFAIDTGIR